MRIVFNLRSSCFDNCDPESFYSVYSVYEEVFSQIFQGEINGYISEGNIDVEKMINFDLSEIRLGNSTSSWNEVQAFYNGWEGFTSCLSFAWEDEYHLRDERVVTLLELSVDGTDALVPDVDYISSSLGN
jgi:hypothetical protein